jgi:4-amino-4-deoxy-L-arabinose transferase-like glycosyltransferase
MARTTVAALLSLAVCVLAVGCWASSYVGESYRIGSDHGSLAFASIDADENFVRQVFGEHRASSAILRGLELSGTERHRFLGFAYVRGVFSGASYWMVAVPYWLIVLATAVLPVRWWFTRRRVRRWRTQGRCLGCGYDLRATPAGDRCPECGLSAPPAPPMPSPPSPPPPDRAVTPAG